MFLNVNFFSLLVWLKIIIIYLSNNNENKKKNQIHPNSTSDRFFRCYCRWLPFFWLWFSGVSLPPPPPPLLAADKQILFSGVYEKRKKNPQLTFNISFLVDILIQIFLTRVFVCVCWFFLNLFLFLVMIENGN